MLPDFLEYPRGSLTVGPKFGPLQSLNPRYYTGLMQPMGPAWSTSAAHKHQRTSFTNWWFLICSCFRKKLVYVIICIEILGKHLFIRNSRFQVLEDFPVKAIVHPLYFLYFLWFTSCFSD